MNFNEDEIKMDEKDEKHVNLAADYLIQKENCQPTRKTFMNLWHVMFVGSSFKTRLMSSRIIKFSSNNFNRLNIHPKY